jgi:hypothetical protein
MVRFLTVVLVTLWVGDATAQTKTTTFRDTMGRTTGKAVTDPTGRTNYYDPMGRTTGRSVTTDRGTTFYDRMGRQSGSASGWHN